MAFGSGLWTDGDQYLVAYGTRTSCSGLGGWRDTFTDNRNTSNYYFYDWMELNCHGCGVTWRIYDVNTSRRDVGDYVAYGHKDGKVSCPTTQTVACNCTAHNGANGHWTCGHNTANAPANYHS